MNHRDTESQRVKMGKWGLTLGGNGSHRFQHRRCRERGQTPFSRNFGVYATVPELKDVLQGELNLAHIV